MTQYNRADEGKPRLVFLGSAWTKLLWCCHRSNVEVGGFGVLNAEELKAGRLVVDDFRMVPQTVSTASVQFDDDGLAEYLDKASQEPDFTPERYMRVWIHTHPGDSASPSGTDENTFRDVFGRYDWAIMAILGRGTPNPEFYTRLRFKVGPLAGAIESLPLCLRYASRGRFDETTWEAEYVANVSEKKYTTYSGRSHHGSTGGSGSSIIIPGANSQYNTGYRPANEQTTGSSLFPADTRIPPQGAPATRATVLWYDNHNHSKWLAEDFSNRGRFCDAVNWRDYSNDITGTGGILFYRGKTGNFYAYPAGGGRPDREYPIRQKDGKDVPESVTFSKWLGEMWCKVPARKPSALSMQKWNIELYEVRDAIYSGRFDSGRSFLKVQRPDTAGAITVAACDDTGVRGDRAPGGTTAGDNGGGHA